MSIRKAKSFFTFMLLLLLHVLLLLLLLLPLPLLLHERHHVGRDHLGVVRRRRVGGHRAHVAAVTRGHGGVGGRHDLGGRPPGTWQGSGQGPHERLVRHGGRRVGGRVGAGRAAPRALVVDAGGAVAGAAVDKAAVGRGVRQEEHVLLLRAGGTEGAGLYPRRRGYRRVGGRSEAMVLVVLVVQGLRVAAVCCAEREYYNIGGQTDTGHSTSGIRIAVVQ